MTIDLERLRKLAGMLGSEHDGEVLAAARAINKLLKAAKLTWRDVIVGVPPGVRVPTQPAWTPPPRPPYYEFALDEETIAAMKERLRSMGVDVDVDGARPTGRGPGYDRWKWYGTPGGGEREYTEEPFNDEARRWQKAEADAMRKAASLEERIKQEREKRRKARADQTTAAQRELDDMMHKSTRAKAFAELRSRLRYAPGVKLSADDARFLYDECAYIDGDPSPAQAARLISLCAEAGLI